MNELLLRRRNAVIQGEPQPIDTTSVTDYVQDGLILHMDGKEKGTNTGKWTSVIGGHQFTNYGATFNSDHVYFDGVDDYLRDNGSFSASGLTSTNSTIEVVCDNENYGIANGVLFKAKQHQYVGAMIDVDGYFIYKPDTTTSRGIYAPYVGVAKASISANDTNAYVNGVAATRDTSKVRQLLYSYYNYSTIGFVSGYLNYFKGKIYSIRIYNRVLTVEEVLQNFDIDNRRFNLGITTT